MKIEKSKALGADAVVLDLEDGVGLEKKDDMRELVKDTLLDSDQQSSFGTSELCVRITGLDTEEMTLRDLEAVLPCERLKTVVIPGPSFPTNLHFASVAKREPKVCCKHQAYLPLEVSAPVDHAVQYSTICSSTSEIPHLRWNWNSAPSDHSCYTQMNERVRVRVI
jgi:citrate lyase beta subunit